MTRVPVILLLIIFIDFPVDSQDLIGLQKKQLETAIKLVYPDFIIDTTSVNRTYKYLKYNDPFNEQTLLVFLSDRDVCTATKLISSYSYFKEVQKELNKKYKSTGQDQWIYRSKDEEYQVKLKRGEWFFSVITSKK